DAPGALVVEELDDRVAGGADAGDHDAGVLDVLVDHAQRVVECGEGDDRGAVLVVVEDGDVQLLLEPGEDLEAAGSGDVLEVDAAVDRGDRPDDADDLLGVGGVEADGPGVDV